MMIKALRTVIHEMLPMGPLPMIEEEEEHRVIGNKNTKKFHEYDCGFIKMMNAENIVLDWEITGEYEPCGKCGYKNKDIITEIPLQQTRFHEEKRVAAAKSEKKYNLKVLTEDPEDVEFCRDPRINKIFKDSKCLTCGHTEGTVKMYPAPHGVRLLGDPHKRWWIYKECSHCGYQTSFRKLKGKN